MAATQDNSLEFVSILSSIVADQYAQTKFNDYFQLKLLKPDPAQCQICTMLVGAAMKYTEVHNSTIDNFITNKLCPMFPTEITPICQAFVKIFGPILINSIKRYGSADQACRDIGVCDKKECNLFPKGFHKTRVSADWTPEKTAALSSIPISSQLPSLKISHFKNTLLGRLLAGKAKAKELEAVFDFIQKLKKEAGQGPLAWIKYLVEKFTGNHTTPIDIDGDHFTQVTAELRGYNWRGRDCDDYDKKVYPGRKTDPYPGTGSDYNCNGIKGKNPKTKASYKDELCANSKQMGVVVFGDSAGAHAEIPENWINGSMWNNKTFAEAIPILLNEVDLPHMSAFTGYTETGITGPVRSIYKYMYERNKCNFRDYQNLAVNGADSGNSFQNDKALARSKEDDHPLLMFMELIGNDVCNHRHSFDVMTKPEKFKENIKKKLEYLDSVVPSGSHMVVLGVANGSLLYEGVNNRIHPAGVTFNEIFDYQNCIESSFCWGWLNTDKTIRDKTTQRAMELNQAYRELFATYKPKNFDIIYYDFPADTIFADYVKNGGDAIDLVELGDGFHPSQLFNALLADHLWENLKRDRPEWLGPVNPNNDLITQLFGNQGGY